LKLMEKCVRQQRLVIFISTTHKTQRRRSMRYKALIALLAIAFACQSGNIFARGGRRHGRGRRVEQKVSWYKIKAWDGKIWRWVLIPMKTRGNPGNPGGPGNGRVIIKPPNGGEVPGIPPIFAPPVFYQPGFPVHMEPTEKTPERRWIHGDPTPPLEP
jgi:hypothetical protein